MKIRVTRLMAYVDERRGIKVGDVFDVIDIGGGGCHIEVNGAGYYMSKEQYEIIENDDFKIDMLKVCYTIIDRNGTEYMVIYLKDYDLGYIEGGYHVVGSIIDDFSYDLLDKDGDKEFDIIRVLDRNGRTIWVRDEKLKESYIINGKRVFF